MKPEIKVLVIPDAHVPFHNRHALALIKKVARAMNPTHGVCIGDWVDLYAINSHGLSAGRVANLEQELQIGAHELKPVRALFDSFTFCSGNHEYRYDRYINDHAPKLHNIAPSIREALDVPYNEWVPYKEHTYIGKMGFTHDLGYSGANALKQTLESFGGNITFGHTHRGGTCYSGDAQGERHVGLNVGWIGDVKSADYMHSVQTRFWQTGFGWVEIMKDGMCFAQFIPIVNNSCVVNGNYYKV